MLLMLAKEFVVGANINASAISEPVVIADKGIWHPMSDNVFETYEVRKARHFSSLFFIILHRSYPYLTVLPCTTLSCFTDCSC